jgi:hypothetical protein
MTYNAYLTDGTVTGVRAVSPEHAMRVAIAIFGPYVDRVVPIR